MSNGRHATNGTAIMTTLTSMLIEVFDLPEMDKVIRASAFDVLFYLFDKNSSVANMINFMFYATSCLGIHF